MKRPSGSSLHLLHNCAASHAYPQVYTDGEAAKRGRRAAQEKEVERKRDGSWAPEVTFYYDVEKGTARLVGTGLGRNYEGVGENEIPMTADAIGEEGNCVLVLDDKLKRSWEVPASRHPQLRALALAACRASGKERARVTWIKWDPQAYEERKEFVEVWRDSAEIDSFELDVIADEIRDSFRAWKRSVAIVKEGKHPNVSLGPWCRFCPARDVCHGQTALIRHAFKAPASWEEELMSLAPERMGEAYQMANVVGAIAHRIKSLCQLHAKEVGPIPLPDGSILQLVEGKATERVVDARKVAEFLSENFGAEVALKACDLDASKASIERALKEVHQGPALKSVLSALREMGAIGKVQGEPKVSAVAPKGRDYAATIPTTPPISTESQAPEAQAGEGE